MVNMNILPLTLSVMLHILMNFLCFQHPHLPSRASAPTVTNHQHTLAKVVKIMSNTPSTHPILPKT
ncbi:hypothetical protein HMPREF0673_00868 [Leyella stercorea DSM 18206]|uniref:Uncharacterized protein n=1 Tax=Leyella stercorea DSM 18206 TaxID=1002367 RepID=G6AW71_9BACT|nr:hypothetical protein HMPREF0673_00868 [Leyella stercorea DSM 18206]